MIAAKMMITVTVGLSPNMIVAEKCRQWNYTSKDYEADKLRTDMPTNFDIMCNEAVDYAQSQMDPRENNYVRLDWIWI